MRNRIVHSVFLSAALLVVSAIPAAAEGGASVGLALLSGDGGVGLNGDYFMMTKDMGMGRSSGFGVDASLNRKGFGGFGNDFSITTWIAEGGYRFQGQAGDKGTWHVQGSAGIIRSNVGLDNLTQNICTLAGIDCNSSSTDFVITPAGAFTYWFSPNMGVKGQVNIPISVTGGGGSAERVDINIVFKMK